MLEVQRVTLLSQAVLLACLGLMMSAVEAEGATLRVERDGSGDFLTIQPAIDAAAEGDTILIGPGRYAEMAPGPFGEPTVGYVDVDDLTIIGVSRDDVIVGPQVPNFQNFGPNGFRQGIAGRKIAFRELTIENVFDGLSVLGDVDIRDCVLQKCSIGINAEADMEIVSTTFLGNEFGIVVSSAPGLGEIGSSVVACTFTLNSRAVYSWNHDLLVRDCQFVQDRDGVRQSGGKTATLQTCTFDCTNVAAQAGLTSRLVLNNCQFSAGAAGNVVLTTEAHLSGSGNRIGAGAVSTMTFTERATADFHGNDILFGDGLAIDLKIYSAQVAVNLGNNFWGTTDLVLLEEKIHHKPDSTIMDNIRTEVTYQPILNQSVPTAKQSMGGFRALFGRH